MIAVGTNRGDSLSRMSMKRLLLLSNSQNVGQRYLEHAEQAIKDVLGTRVKSVLFFPLARVFSSLDDFAAKVKTAFSEMDYGLNSIHEISDWAEAVRNAEAYVVGGGNTFYLLTNLYRLGVLDKMRERVEAGIPYIGWSAGANITCPTIGTTNDMPIVEPPSFNALKVVPFQINPHYLDHVAEGEEHIETRDDRINEFIEVNPGRYVVGLRDGSHLRIENSTIKLMGANGARVFLKGRAAKDYGPEESVQFLLDEMQRCADANC